MLLRKSACWIAVCIYSLTLPAWAVVNAGAHSGSHIHYWFTQGTRKTGQRFHHRLRRHIQRMLRLLRKYGSLNCQNDHGDGHNSTHDCYNSSHTGVLRAFLPSSSTPPPREFFCAQYTALPSNTSWCNSTMGTRYLLACSLTTLTYLLTRPG